MLSSDTEISQGRALTLLLFKKNYLLFEVWWMLLQFSEFFFFILIFFRFYVELIHKNVNLFSIDA